MNKHNRTQTKQQQPRQPQPRRERTDAREKDLKERAEKAREDRAQNRLANEGPRGAPANRGYGFKREIGQGNHLLPPNK